MPSSKARSSSPPSCPQTSACSCRPSRPDAAARRAKSSRCAARSRTRPPATGTSSSTWASPLFGQRKWDEAAAAFQKTVTLTPRRARPTTRSATRSSRRTITTRRSRPSSATPRSTPGAERRRFAGRGAAARRPLRGVRGRVPAGPHHRPSFYTPGKASPSRGRCAATGRAAPGRGQGARRRGASQRPVGLGFDQAWSLYAEGKTAEALTAGESHRDRRRGQEAGRAHGFIALDRRPASTPSGQPAEALKQVAVALDRGEKAKLAGGAMTNLRRAALYERIDAESRLGRKADARPPWPSSRPTRRSLPRTRSSSRACTSRTARRPWRAATRRPRRDSSRSASRTTRIAGSA